MNSESDYSDKPLHKIPIVPIQNKIVLKKHQIYNKQHSKLRRRLLNKNPICTYQYPGCTILATDANHLRYPARDINDYKACCANCHMIWHGKENTTNYLNNKETR